MTHTPVAGGRRRIVVAITGASGAIYGVRAVEMLREMPDVETHLIITEGARKTLAYETATDTAAVMKLADVVYREDDLAAPISSGSYRTDGMVVIPCSIKTLSGVANCHNDNLVVRAADVVLKERRRLVLVVRETPLHLSHLRLMTEVTAAGGIIAPPVPAFITSHGRLTTLSTRPSGASSTCSALTPMPCGDGRGVSRPPGALALTAEPAVFQMRQGARVRRETRARQATRAT